MEGEDSLPKFYERYYSFSSRMERHMKQGVSTNFTRINVCITDKAEETHDMIRSKSDQERVGQ